MNEEIYSYLSVLSMDSGMGMPMVGNETVGRSDDNVSAFTKHPFDLMADSCKKETTKVPSFELMTESRKKEIFQRAMHQHPDDQDEFNRWHFDDGEGSSSIGAWQWRLKDGRLIWSPGMFKVMGRDPELGPPSYEEAVLTLFDASEQDRYLAQMGPVLEGKADSAYFTVKCLRPGGEQYLTGGVTVPMKDEQGNVCELCGYLIDQDAHKQLYVGEELLDTTEREDVRVSEIASNDRIMHQKALADKNNFIAHVFHEVRNPMNVVYLGLQTLAEELDDPELKEIVQLMQSSAERAVTILNDTLDYSKFELGTVHLDKTLVLTSEFVEKCAKDHRAQAHQLNISLTVEEGYDSVCEIDTSRMMQVMNNLFSNAMKFTLPKKGHITVRYDHIDENKATITVSDNGIGIREEDQGRIFTPYNQIDNSVSERKGMGMGLSVSRKIANAHDGDLVVQSTQDRGSTFTITFPAVKQIEKIDRPESAQRLPGRLDGLHALIVDDDRINRIILSKMLKRHGCLVATMKDGAEFLEWTRDPSHVAYDLVLLDDFMPKLDGSEAIRIARQEGFLGWVLMLTGNKQKNLDDCGVNHVMHKPLRFPDLVEYVEMHDL